MTVSGFQTQPPQPSVKANTQSQARFPFPRLSGLGCTRVPSGPHPVSRLHPDSPSPAGSALGLLHFGAGPDQKCNGPAFSTI